MTKSPRKNVPDVGIELGAACMPSGHASDRATAQCLGIRQSAAGIGWSASSNGSLQTTVQAMRVRFKSGSICLFEHVS